MLFNRKSRYEVNDMRLYKKMERFKQAIESDKDKAAAFGLNVEVVSYKLVAEYLDEIMEKTKRIEELISMTQGK